MTFDILFPPGLEPGLAPVFLILTVQILLGGVDNLLHHEMTEALPTRPSARYELSLHGARELIYAGIFGVFALLRPEGVWAIALAAILVGEILITLADFIEEDRTRTLPAFERVLHTILALNYGAVLALLAPVLWNWAQAPTGIFMAERGVWTPLLLVAALGVGVWGVRDAYAALTLRPDTAPAPKPSGQTVLVTGATGFLGQAVVANLKARGDQVAVLTRNPKRARRKLGRGVRCFADLGAITPTTRIDAIVNLAGANVADQPWSNARKRTLLQSRLRVTQAVTDLIDRLNIEPRVLVSASAVGVYGDGGEAELTEAALPPAGVFTAELCKAWEQEAGKAELSGVRVVRLRFGLVFGRDGGAFPRLTLSRPFGLLAQFGAGRQWMAWIRKADAVGLIHHALRTDGLAGPVNAVGPVPIRHGNVIRTLAGRRLILPIPAALLRFALGEMSTLFLASQKVTATKALKSGYRFIYPDFDAAAADLTAPALTQKEPRHA